MNFIYNLASNKKLEGYGEVMTEEKQELTEN